MRIENISFAHFANSHPEAYTSGGGHSAGAKLAEELQE